MPTVDFTRLVLDARYVRVGRHDGISRYTAGLCHGVAKLLDGRPDLAVELMVSDPRQLDKLPDLPWFMGPDPVSAAELTTSRILNRRRADVVYSPMQTMGAVRRRFGLILTLHDVIYYDHPTPPGDLPRPVRLGWRLFHASPWPQRAALNRADAVVTVSETSAASIRDRRLTKRPLYVVPNAADPHVVPTTEQAVAAWEQRESSGDHEPRALVYMGSFMPYKDVETLVRAVAELPGHRLHLASGISPVRRAELAALAPADRLVFHNGIDDDHYRHLLKRATALVHASHAEGYGLPLMEALCAGTPVICTDIPIFHEVCEGAAEYVAAGDAAGFARAVRNLRDLEVARERITAGLRVARRSSWERSARELLDVVDRVAFQRLNRQLNRR